jgi:hypothetical protein
VYIRAHLIGRFDLKVLFEKLGDPCLIHPILAYAYILAFCIIPLVPLLNLPSPFSLF